MFGLIVLILVAILVVPHFVKCKTENKGLKCVVERIWNGD
jgi:hypothetical protein